MADGRYGHFGKANMLSEGVAASERLAGLGDARRLPGRGSGWCSQGGRDEVRKVGLDQIQEGARNLSGKPRPEAGAKGGLHMAGRRERGLEQE